MINIEDLDPSGINCMGTTNLANGLGAASGRNQNVKLRKTLNVAKKEGSNIL